MANWLTEARFVLRGLRRTPAFSATIALTLILGLGLTSAIFAFSDGYLFRPLPFPEADRAYVVLSPGAGLRQTDVDALRHSAIADLGFVEWTISHRRNSYRLQVGDRVTDFFVEGVSRNFRQTLSLPLVAGRDFTDEDHRVVDPMPVWLMHWFWMKEFHGDRNVIGRSFDLAETPTPQRVVVVGILGPTVASLQGANEPPAAVAPEIPPASPDPNRSSSPIVMLPSGMTETQASSLIAGVINAANPAADGKARTIRLRSLVESQVAGGRPTATVLFAGAMLVLLLAAITIVHLLLARGAARASEIRTRAALGASRWQVTRLFLTEGLILGSAGIAGGLAFGVWLSRVIAASIPMFPTSGRNLSAVPILFDSRVILFTIVLGLVVSCFGAIWPARRALARSFAIGNRGVGGVKADIPASLSRAILASELAVATVVMVGTVFIGSGIWRYLHQPLGFDYHDRYWVALSKSDQQPLTQDERNVAERALRNAPGVNAVTWDGRANRVTLEVPGRSVNTKEMTTSSVTSGHFDAWSLQLREGRWFEARELAGDEPVAVVDEKLARTAWPEISAIDQNLRIGGVTRKVIGVVEPRRASLMREPAGQAYVPAAPGAILYSAVVWIPRASATDVTRIASAVAAAVPGSTATTRAVTLQWLFMRETGEAEFQGPIIWTFGLLAFLLAGIGVFGLISFLVEQRRREFGIRFALGAQRFHIWRHVTAQSVVPAIAGLVIGLATARALESVVQASVFGWKSSGSLAMAIVTVALLIVAVLAAVVPARRAMRIDPAITLRME